LKDDIKTSVLDVKQTHYSRYQKPSYTYSNKIQRVTKDVIKFIPFSIFILIPGLELLLPAWLIIFPNATPSQFQSKATGQKKMETLIKNRDQGAKRLLYKLPKFLHLLLENPHLTKEEREEVNELVKLVESDKVMYTELLHYKHLFYKYCDFKHFKTTTLIDMAHFMGLNPVTGLNTINNLLSLFRVSIQIDNKFVSWFTKIILRRELRLFFNKIRREDSYLFWEQVESLDEKAFDSILIERGIDFHNQDYDSKLKDYKMWQSISNLANIPDTLLLFCRLLEFAEDLKRYNYSEKEEDMIKRIKSNTEYFERKKKLEEYLGLSKLKAEKRKFILAELDVILKNKDTKEKDTNEELQSEKKPLTIKDYREFQTSLADFKIRHKSIVQPVNKIYEEFDELLDELHQNIVIGYFERKEDKIMKIREHKYFMPMEFLNSEELKYDLKRHKKDKEFLG